MPSGSKRSFTSSKACTMRRPNILSWNSERTMPSPCSPEWLPLYSATMSNASSAMARSALTSSSCRRFRTGRTCRRPTEAWAYHVPVVPCRSKSAVRRSVKSARSSRWTAQSSTNETGFPSDFIDIMMLRPWVRTSVIFACSAWSGASRTPPWCFPGSFQRKPRSAIVSCSPARRRRFSAASSSANSTRSSAAGSPRTNAPRDGASAGILRAEFDHRPVNQLDCRRPQRHEMPGCLHRCAEGRKMADADDLVARKGRELQLDGFIERECSLGSDQQVGKVVRPGARNQRVDVVASHPPQDVGEFGGDLVGLAGAEGEHLVDQRCRRAPPAAVAVDAAELGTRSVGQQRIDRHDVFAHPTIADRPPAAGIVGGHASDCRPRGGRDVDGKEQAVRFQDAVQLVKNDPRLAPSRAQRRRPEPLCR